MPLSYTWNIVSTPLSGALPNPGPYVAQPPFTGRDARRDQFERGIRFANVPGGRADFVVHGGPRVQHVNSLQNIFLGVGDVVVDDGNYSGAVKYRFRSYRDFKVPDSVNKVEFRSIDRFTNPVFPFTGRYPLSHVFFTIDLGSSQFQGSMDEGKSRYVAGQLTNDRVIVAGGWNTVGGDHAISSSQTYFSGTGLWTTIAPMPYRKSQAAGIVLSGTGDFVVFGGTTGSFWDPIEGRRGCRYSFAGGTWSPMANSASVPRRDFEVVQIPDGRVFLPGGEGGVSFTGSEFWDPTTNLFSGTLPIPLAPLNREAYTTSLLNDGTVLVCGGRDPIVLEPSRHAFRFYPTLLSWSIEPSMSIGRAGHCTTVIEGLAFVMGGFTPGATASFPFGFPGPLGGTGDDYAAIDNVEVYDPDLRTWSFVPVMPKPRARFSTIGLLRDGGRIIAFGGYHTTEAITQVDEFSNDLYAWPGGPRTPLLKGVFDIKAVQFNHNANAQLNFKIIIPGGASGSTTFSGSQLFTTAG